MDLRQLVEARSARALDEDSEGRLLVGTDLTGTFQLHELADGHLRALTDFAEPVSGHYVPQSRMAVVLMDTGGSERRQLYLMDLDDPPGSDVSRLRPVAPSPDHVHSFLGARRDGRQIAFSSNRRNGVDFDVYLVDLTEEGDAAAEPRLIWAEGGWANAASGYSPGGRYLSCLLAGRRALDCDMMLLDLESGECLQPLPHPDEAALIGAPRWIDEGSFLVSSTIGHDFAAIVSYDLVSATTSTVLAEDHDLECHVSPDGAAVLVVANVGGASRGDLYATGRQHGAIELRPIGSIPLPGLGVIDGSLVTPEPIVAMHGTHVTYSFSSPTVPGDVWRAVPGKDEPSRLTTSPGPDAVHYRLAEPALTTIASFDGEPVPLFVYRPEPRDDDAGTSIPPTVLIIHGGPESQSMLTFSPIVQGLVGGGFAVVVPNVRGSTGYGRRFASLDDTVRRLDSVADLAAIHEWLPSAGLDGCRAALWGGSYGGYMVLAGLAFQPERWAAGVDIVGISDLVTFLENTSAYRRAYREVEYGSLAEHRDFLESASPMGRVDEIRAPLFVIHGQNDPRVPVSEAYQLVASLERRGVPHELIVYPDEGHGLAKLANRLDAYPRAIAFLERYLAPTD